MTPFSGPSQAGIMGRRERFDVLNAAMINGIAPIFSTTTTRICGPSFIPAALVIAAILALAEYRPVSGKDFLNAVVIGVEVALPHGEFRLPPSTTTAVGTAPAHAECLAPRPRGKLLGLNEQQMVWALGLAASQPVGLSESFGSMNKSFNPGRAANDGLMAAILASKNFTSSDEMIEAKRGWANTVSPSRTTGRSRKDWGNTLRGGASTRTSRSPAESCCIPRSMRPYSCATNTR